MRIRLAALCFLGLSLSGCATDREPLTPTSAVENTAPAAVTAALGEWQLRVDAAASAASLELATARTPAQNDDLYLLSIGNFLRGDSFRITKVARSAETLDLTWEFAHPIPPPTDPTAPASAGNRADLGISGLVVFGVDVSTTTGNTYFTGRVANTDTVTNADVYYEPNDLLPDWNLIARIYPCQALVNERGATGSRVGISNGGDPTGNYGTNGWTRSELGAAAPFTGWTGFGVLHQGQRTRRTLQLNLAALASGPVSLPVALIARYQDPRGGATPEEKRANRLPAVPADAAKFGYRMPHGTWDMPRIRYVGETGGFDAETASSSTLGFQIEDWDVYATETTESDLSLDPTLTHVQPGAAGLPTIELSLPGVIGDTTAVVSWDPTETLQDDDSLYGGDVAADSGLPGDALFFAREIDKPAGTVAGTFTGLLRVTDPEDALAAALTPLPLAPNLVPLDEDFPQPRFYQVCTVTVTGPASGGWATPVGDGVPTGASVFGIAVGADGLTVLSGYFFKDIDFGGGTRSAGPTSASAWIAAYDAAGQYLWDRIYGDTTGDDQLPCLDLDASGEIWALGQFSNTVDLGSGPVMSAGWRDLFLVHLDADGNQLSSWTMGGTGDEMPRGIRVDQSGRLLMCGNSPLLSPTIYGELLQFDDLWFCKGSADGQTVDWVKSGSSPTWVRFNAMELDAQDNPVYCGYVQDGGSIDSFTLPTYWPGLAGYNDAWMARYLNDGTLDWYHHWGATDLATHANSAAAVSVGANRIHVAGNASGLVNFGGGAVDAGDDAGVLVAFDLDGTWQFQRLDSGTYWTQMVRRPSDNLLLVGSYRQPTDFGGGVRGVDTPTIESLVLLETNPAGAWVRDAVWTEPTATGGGPLANAPNNEIRLTVAGFGVTDLDPGPGVFEVTPPGIVSTYLLPLHGDLTF